MLMHSLDDRGSGGSGKKCFKGELKALQKTLTRFLRVLAALGLKGRRLEGGNLLGKVYLIVDSQVDAHVVGLEEAGNGVGRVQCQQHVTVQQLGLVIVHIRLTVVEVRGAAGATVDYISDVNVHIASIIRLTHVELQVDVPGVLLSVGHLHVLAGAAIVRRQRPVSVLAVMQLVEVDGVVLEKFVQSESK